MEVYIYFV